MSLLSIISPFISGTINLCLEHILQYDELSITRHPFSANFGAHCFDTSFPAENKAKSIFLFTTLDKDITLSFLFLNISFFPTDFSEATRINSSIKIFFCSKTLSISLPTIPVAPTIASFIFNFYSKIIHLLF